MKPQALMFTRPRIFPRVRRARILEVLALSCALTAGLFSGATASAAEQLAFPGAVGWARNTPGGRGGQIIKVTTLNPTGPGSITEAVETKGPRIIVFEVGGIVDLNRKELRIREPFVTIAGQTAPDPGITFIRGGIVIGGHDVVIQHIRVRAGSTGLPKLAGLDFDSITTIAAYNVIVDHCSLTWSTDENLSASGPRFEGKTPDDWRKNTSRQITFSHNIIAEGLAHSTHAKGEHSKGSLIHDNANDIFIYGNLYAHNKERNPLFKGGVRGAVVNNLIYDPGDKATHYNLIAEEWGKMAYQTGHMTLVGNVYRAGLSTRPGLPLFMLGGSGDVEIYTADNIQMDWLGNPLPETGVYTNSSAKIKRAAQPLMPPAVTVLPAKDVQDAVIRDVGARPWQRDHHDARIVADTIEGRGYVIDSEDEVGGYPKDNPTAQKFDPAQWDLKTMVRKQP